MKLEAKAPRREDEDPNTIEQIRRGYTVIESRARRKNKELGPWRMRGAFSSVGDALLFYRALKHLGYARMVKMDPTGPRVITESTDETGLRFTPKAIAGIRKALKDDAAGNSKCTMTDLDLACNMLDELARLTSPIR